MGSVSKWRALCLAIPAFLAGWAVADMDLVTFADANSTGAYELKSTTGGLRPVDGAFALSVQTDASANWPGVHFKAPGGALGSFHVRGA